MRNRFQAPGSRYRLNAGRRAFQSALRTGFTLVELLVVVTILGILATMTFTAYTRTADSDRVPSAARQLQSYIEGARDRAIYAKQPRGVRLLLDPETIGLGIPQTVSGMVFVGAPGKYTTGTIELTDNMTTPPTVTTTMGSGADWDNLFNRGLLSATPRLRLIINDSTSEYLHIAKDTGGMGAWVLTRMPTVTYAQAPTAYAYELELEPAVLPNQEPRLLAKEVVIDLSKCVIPTAWGNVNQFSNQMDIMFSPRGTVIDDVTSAGLVHFFIGDTPDVKQGRAGLVLNPLMNPPTDYVDIDVYDTAATATLDTDFSAANAGQYQVILRTQGSDNWFLRNLDFVEPSPGLPMTNPMPVGTPYRIHFSPSVPNDYYPVAARIEFIPELKRGDERIVTLTPQTGNISTYEPGADGDDLFRFAKVGAVAK